MTAHAARRAIAQRFTGLSPWRIALDPLAALALEAACAESRAAHAGQASKAIRRKVLEYGDLPPSDPIKTAVRDARRPDVITKVRGAQPVLAAFVSGCRAVPPC